jgi:nicotinamidase-related amidase
MPALDSDTSALLVIDFQTRLMPAIEDGATVIANARRLLDGAELLGVPALFTEAERGRPRGHHAAAAFADRWNIPQDDFRCLPNAGVPRRSAGPARPRRLGLRDACLRLADGAWPVSGWEAGLPRTRRGRITPHRKQRGGDPTPGVPRRRDRYY